MLTLRPRPLGRSLACGIACLFAACGALRADDDGQELEANSQVSEKEYVVPVLEYSFERDLEHAAPMDYRSVTASGLPLALRHRIDSIWSGGSFFSPFDATASDFPVVAEVQYRLRRSAWSDPERMARARLLDGTRFQSLITREFSDGRKLEMSAAVQHAESVLSSEGSGLLERTSIPVEIRAALSQNTDLIAGVEIDASRLAENGDVTQAQEQAIKVGVGSNLGEGLYGQITAGARAGQFDDGRAASGMEADATLVWQVGTGSQYTLTFNRSTRPSLVANDFIEADTISFEGDFTLSDMWSAYYGVSKSWIDSEPRFGKEIYSGEMAVSFSPAQSIRFSGGYIFRSGSLGAANDEEAEQIIRLSASVLY